MAEPNPFEVLALAPTLDRGQVKRAYFIALARHPPHGDPEGFQRVRAAYELLSRPGGLEAAYAAAPLDLEAELAARRERYGSALAHAGEWMVQQLAGAEAGERFVKKVSTMTCEEALVAFGAHSRTL